MKTRERYDFNPIYHGTTHEGAVISLTINGEAFNFTGCNVVMHVRTTATSDKVVEELSLIKGNFEIDGTQLRLLPRLITIPAGDYVYDILLTKSDGSREIYVYGKLTVLQPVTRL